MINIMTSIIMLIMFNYNDTGQAGISWRAEDLWFHPYTDGDGDEDHKRRRCWYWSLSSSSCSSCLTWLMVVMMKLLGGDRRRWFDFTLSSIHSSSCFTMITIIDSEEEEESSLHIFVHFFVSPNFMWYTHCSWMMKDDIFCIWWRVSNIVISWKLSV